MYDRLRRLVLEDEDFGGFFRFLGVGFEVEGPDSGEVSRDAEPPIPAAARKSSTRSSSPASLIIRHPSVTKYLAISGRRKICQVSIGILPQKKKKKKLPTSFPSWRDSVAYQFDLFQMHIHCQYVLSDSLKRLSFWDPLLIPSLLSD